MLQEEPHVPRCQRPLQPQQWFTAIPRLSENFLAVAQVQSAKPRSSSCTSSRWPSSLACGLANAHPGWLLAWPGNRPTTCGWPWMRPSKAANGHGDRSSWDPEAWDGRCLTCSRAINTIFYYILLHYIYYIILYCIVLYYTICTSYYTILKTTTGDTCIKLHS